MPGPEYLTIPEVARLAGVTPQAVFYAVRDGRLPGAFRVGRQWAIPREAAESYRPRAPNRGRTTRRVPRS